MTKIDTTNFSLERFFIENHIDVDRLDPKIVPSPKEASEESIKRSMRRMELLDETNL